MRVLIIEQDEDVASSLKECLMMLGYEVETCKSTKIAQHLVLKTLYDRILLDYSTFLKYYPNRELTALIEDSRVIITSTHPKKNLIRNLKNKIIIKKPFDIQDLEVILK